MSRYADEEEIRRIEDPLYDTRARFIEGRIDVEAFEEQVGRLLRGDDDGMTPLGCEIGMHVR